MGGGGGGGGRGVAMEAMEAGPNIPWPLTVSQLSLSQQLAGTASAKSQMNQ